MSDKLHLIQEKYGNYWGELFSTREDFEREYMTTDLFIAAEWEEFGYTLVEVGDDNMWSEIVAIKIAHPTENSC